MQPSNHLLKQAIHLIGLVSLVSATFCVFFFNEELHFPWVTSKEIPWRSLVGISFACWLTLATIDKSFRIAYRTNYLLLAVAGFVGIVGLANLLSPIPDLAIWSRLERMEGFSGLVHNLMFFLTLVGFLRTQARRELFLALLASLGAMICIYGLFVDANDIRIYRPLGNPIYVAQTALFSFFICLRFLHCDLSELRSQAGTSKDDLLQTALLAAASMIWLFLLGTMTGVGTEGLVTVLADAKLIFPLAFLSVLPSLFFLSQWGLCRCAKPLEKTIARFALFFSVLSLVMVVVVVGAVASGLVGQAVKQLVGERLVYLLAVGHAVPSLFFINQWKTQRRRTVSEATSPAESPQRRLDYLFSLFMLGLLSLFATAIYRSSTRGIVIALAVGVVFYMVCMLISVYRRKPDAGEAMFRLSKYVAFVLPVVLGVGVLVGIVASDHVTSKDRRITLLKRFELTGGQSSQSRIQMWKASFRGAIERPLLGYGQEHFSRIFYEYQDPLRYQMDQPFVEKPHNLYLLWLNSAGIIGLGAYLAIFWFAYKVVRQQEHFSHAEAIVFGGLLFALILHHGIEVRSFSYNLFLFGLLGVLASVPTKKQDRQAKPVAESDLSTFTKLGAVTGIVVMAVALQLLFVIPPYRSAHACSRIYLESHAGFQFNQVKSQEVAIRGRADLERVVFHRRELLEVCMESTNRYKVRIMDGRSRSFYFGSVNEKMAEYVALHPNDWEMQWRYSLFLLGLGDPSFLQKSLSNEGAVYYCDAALAIVPNHFKIMETRLLIARLMNDQKTTERLVSHIDAMTGSDELSKSIIESVTENLKPAEASLYLDEDGN